MGLLYVFLASLLAIMVASGVYSLYVVLMVSRGVYPKAGSATMADVVRLVEQGHHGLALRCYRGVTKASLKDSSAAIAAMRKQYD